MKTAYYLDYHGTQTFSTVIEEKIKKAVGEAIHFDSSVVDELPETGEPYIIYFVKVDSSSASNVHNEYIWVDEQFELIGSTDEIHIDLDDYYTKDEVDENLSLKADTSYVNIVTSNLDTTINNVSTSVNNNIIDLNNAINNVSTSVNNNIIDLNNAINNVSTSVSNLDTTINNVSTSVNNNIIDLNNAINNVSTSMISNINYTLNSSTPTYINAETLVEQNGRNICSSIYANTATLTDASNGSTGLATIENVYEEFVNTEEVVAKAQIATAITLGLDDDFSVSWSASSGIPSESTYKDAIEILQNYISSLEGRIAILESKVN